jgi:shikimate kinase
MKLTRTVALVGMMGAGKSSIGRRLATRLGVPFKDADAEIEHAAGRTIAEIFARYGEPAFRDGERKVIARLLTEPVHVMATGGGAFMDATTRQRLKSGATTMWLRAPVDVLLARTARRDNRPLLKEGNPRETLERLLEARGPTYALADHTINSEDEPHSATVDRIVALLTKDGVLAP